MTCLLACSPSIRLAIDAFLPCAGGCGVLVRSCLRSAPAGVGFWSVPVWGWPVGWFGLVVFSPFLLGLCGLLGGLRPFVSLVWSCWHLLRRLPFTSARSTWGPFTSQSQQHTQVVSMLRGILRVEHAAPTRGTNSPKVARRDLILGFFQFWFGVNTGLGRKLTSLCEVCRALFWAHRIRKPLACRTIAGRRYRLVRRWHPGCCRSRSSCLLLSRTLVRFWACCCKLGVWLICLLRREPAQNHPGALNTQLRGGGSAGGSSATKRKRKE